MKLIAVNQKHEMVLNGKKLQAQSPQALLLSVFQTVQYSLFQIFRYMHFMFTICTANLFLKPPELI